MTIDLNLLTAAELDQLIADASIRRATMNPPVTAANPQGQVQAVTDPKWVISLVEAGTLIQIRDPGHGWLNYVIPPASRAIMASFLLQHALLPPPTGTTVVVAPPSASGGSTVH